MSPRVTYIRFVFHGSDLLEGFEKANRYEKDDSARKFADLCLEELEQIYPGVLVEVMNAETDRDLPSQVTAVDDQLEEGSREVELLEELERVEEVCQQVYGKLKWLVPRRWENIIEVQGISSIRFPISVIDWACKEGIIDEAEDNQGVWEFPWDKWVDWFDEVTENPVLQACNGILGLCVVDNSVNSDFCCFGNEILECPIVDSSSEIDILFLMPERFSQPLLESRNASVTLSFRGEDTNIEIACFDDRSDWSYPWAFKIFAHTIVDRARERNIEAIALDMGFQLVFKSYASQIKTLHGAIVAVSDALSHLVRESEEYLGGIPVWKELYTRDEEAFCKQVLQPLLKRMGFSRVRYTHGPDEHGRDFVFCDETRFGEVRYCALQAKTGNISGGARSQVDEIFRQIRLGFRRPFEELDEEKYISEFIVAISGHFTSDAKQAIRTELKRLDTRGSVYFWDKKRILDLIREYYTDRGDHYERRSQDSPFR
jgi:hypothetical protein